MEPKLKAKSKPKRQPPAKRKSFTIPKQPLLVVAIWVAVIAAGATVLMMMFDKPGFNTVAYQEEWQPEGDVAAFRRDCVEGVIKGGAIPSTCQSFDAMRKTYGVDPEFLLDVEKGKMTMTARRIARGEILTEDQLKACIREGACREVPIIPPKYHGNERAANSPQGVKARTLFWHLVNDGSLTPEICAFIDICKAYYRMGLIQFNEPAGAR